jgi:hypothetical protein
MIIPRWKELHGSIGMDTLHASDLLLPLFQVQPMDSLHLWTVLASVDSKKIILGNKS